MPYSSLLETYLGSGNVADLPVAATIAATVPPGWVALWFAKDTGDLYGIANGDVAWTTLAGGGADPDQSTSLSQISSSLSGAISSTSSLSTAVSTGLSSTNSTNVTQSTSLSIISSSLSGAISSTASLSTAVSTVISGSISTTLSTAASATASLSTAIGTAGAAWALAGTGQTATGVWDFAIDGAKASVDFVGLAGFTDFMILVRSVTQASSGLVALRASVDNGANFLAASGDYVFLTTAGADNNSTAFGQFHITNATAARSGKIIVEGANINGMPKYAQCPTAGDGTDRYFVASTSPINALRIFSTAAGNLIGGKIYLLAR